MTKFTKNNIGTQQNNADDRSEETNKMEKILREFMWKAPDIGGFSSGNEKTAKEFMDKLLVYETNENHNKMLKLAGAAMRGHAQGWFEAYEGEIF